MARISSFPIDNNIQDKDAWIGTEATNRVTRQFTAQGVADYLNINSKISISAQMVFKFVEAGASGGDITDPLNAAGATTLNFAEIATIRMSVTSNSGMTVTEFMTYIDGSQILINQQRKIDEFGHYTIKDYVLDAGADPLFATLTLEHIGGTGLLVKDKTYDVASFYKSNQGVPTFIYPQVVPAKIWNITHNLGKFPSITVIDTGNTVVQGEYTYINNNSVALKFSAPFGGKAYLN